MRVLLQADMEGVSQITTVQQIVPIWPDYFDSGRQLLTDDVVAAITGLFQGGATEVVVDDQHLGQPANVIPDRLPDGATMLPSDVIYQQLQERAYDAVFQVGRHARWGTNDAFISHTQMPGIAFAIDGRPITESHICAFRAGVPVLGITGDDKLGSQIDGALKGTPFLAVKHSRSLTETAPRYAEAAASFEAIQVFARQCIENWRTRPVPELPEAFMLSAYVGAEAAHELSGVHGLELTGDEVVSVRCEGWWEGAEQALEAATYTATADLIRQFSKVRFSSPAEIDDFDPEALETARHELTWWLRQPQLAWSR